MVNVVNMGPGEYPSAGALCAGQTGTGASQNVIDRGDVLDTALLEVITTVGATPSLTFDIQGSCDGTNFFNVAYATAAAPETATVATPAAITTATTTRFIMRKDQPWRFLRLNITANVNVTVSANLYQFSSAR